MFQERLTPAFDLLKQNLSMRGWVRSFSKTSGLLKMQMTSPAAGARSSSSVRML